MEKTFRKRFKTDGDGKFIEVSVIYDKGGYNYFTGDTEKRGYKVMVQPVTVRERSVCVTAFSGFKTTVKEVSRYSAKAHQSVYEAVEPHMEGIAEAFRENGMEQAYAKVLEAKKNVA